MAEDLSRMWDSFSLRDDEDAEMEIQQQDWEVGTIRGRSCLVGKLIADRMVSKEVIRSTIQRGEKLEKTPTFKVMGDNLFLVELESEKDKRRILEGRPWSVEGHMFAIEDYDGLSSPSSYLFEKVAFWVRIYNLPLACMSLIIGNQIGSSMGQVLKVDVDDGGMGWGECLRVKVLLDLKKPLSRGRKLKINGSPILIHFQYEKLPKFCFQCGAIMHGGTGCPERHDVRAQNATTQYGPWLRAPSPTRKIGGRPGMSQHQWSQSQRGHENSFERPEQDRGPKRGRRQSPVHERSASRERWGGGDFSGTAAGGKTQMESELRRSKIPSEGDSYVTENSNRDSSRDMGDENFGSFEKNPQRMAQNKEGKGEKADMYGDIQGKKSREWL
jgi:hypothetical protein